jgi:hypothetical protein
VLRFDLHKLSQNVYILILTCIHLLALANNGRDDISNVVSFSGKQGRKKSTMRHIYHHTDLHAPGKIGVEQSQLPDKEKENK